MRALQRPPEAPAAALRFRWPWRPHQQRLLDALDAHLEDRRLHVVAAPGSGKTVLGLELVRRLDRPALVLSPTRAIRDQWLARLADFGVEVDPEPSWVSRDLDRPAFLTSTTYQALHAREGARDSTDSVRGLEDTPSPAEMASLAHRLAAAGVEVLVLDEAHHLRNEWWKALSGLLEDLPSLTLVSLTATPPYDVAGREWRRYEALCGPIDEEIPVPELVKAGTLCPHQDFVWFVEPGDEESVDLRAYDAAVASLCDDLLHDEAFGRAVEAHPWIAPGAGDADPAAFDEAVLAEPERAVALLVHLRARGGPPPRALLDLLALEPADVPEPSPRWWQVLLDTTLRSETWSLAADDASWREALRRRLRNDGLLFRGAPRLEPPQPLAERLSQSPRKLGACVEIHRLERGVRGDSLRQAFLTDFIRDEPPVPGESPRLGAWPLFDALRRATPADAHPQLALVTGRLSVLHQRVAARLGPGASFEPLVAAPGFVRVTAPSAGRLVGEVTRLLEDGSLHTIVGTRALLGEGWDAPALNSVVLASYVGSFVLTNQMRGRALRTRAADPEKWSSLWHLAAVEERTPSGMRDLEALAERFQTFVGLAAGARAIESGIERLELPTRPPHAPASEWHERVNREMGERLQRGAELRRRWNEALEGEGVQRLAPSLDVRRPPAVGRTLVASTLSHVFRVAGWSFGSGIAFVLRNTRRFDGLEDLLFAAGLALAVGAGLAFWPFVRVLRLLLGTLPVDGAVRQIGDALLEALCRTGVIAADPAGLELRVATLADGRVSASLRGGSFRERSLFADALGELLAPIENPRYVLTRPGVLWWRRVDYHAVPGVLGERKERAEVLLDCWRRRLGPGELVYTRNREGRRALLRARARAFSAVLASGATRTDRWA